MSVTDATAPASIFLGPGFQLVAWQAAIACHNRPLHLGWLLITFSKMCRRWKGILSERRSTVSAGEARRCHAGSCPTKAEALRLAPSLVVAIQPATKNSESLFVQLHYSCGI